MSIGHSMVSLLAFTVTLISLNVYSIDCLSLTELHSTLPSNNRYKLRLQEEKSLRDAIRNLNHQSGSSSPKDISIYEPQAPSSSYRYPYALYASPSLVDNSYSLPDDFKANLKYIISPKSPLINEIDKRQEVVMDIPLEYTADIPYEIYPNQKPLKQYPNLRGQSSSDVYSQILASNIARLLEMEQNNGNNHGKAVSNFIIPSSETRKKRTLVKRNNRSGLSSNSNHRRSSRVSTHSPGKLKLSSTHVKPVSDVKHHSVVEVREQKLSKKPSRKLGEEKKQKLNNIALKSTSRDSVHTTKGKVAHTTVPKMIHSKVINRKGSKEFDKKHVAENFRKIETTRKPTENLNRKEKPKSVTNPSVRQSSMKEFFNDIDIPGGSRSIVKRSISSSIEASSSLPHLGLRRDDDIVDGYNGFSNDDDIDTGDESMDGDNGDLDSEINGEYRLISQSPSSPMAMQSNPWLVDEATRTLMRSLTVKRRKRGYISDPMTLIGLNEINEMADKNNDENDEDNNNNNSNKNSANIYTDERRDDKIAESDEPSQPAKTNEFSDTFALDNGEATPTRIVKKDGVTLESNFNGEDNRDKQDSDNQHSNNNAKRTGHGIALKDTNNSIKGHQLISGLEDNDGDETGANDTFLEEEFSEGIITIGDLDDLTKLNDTFPIKLPTKSKKQLEEASDNVNIDAPSTISTLAPLQLTNDDEGRIDDKLEDSIVNGSTDHELVETTISDNKRLYFNKKKRSVTSNLDALDESLVAQEEAKFAFVDEKLEKIEEALIWEALDMIKSKIGNGESSNIASNKVRHRIESRLNAAYDLEDMRISLADLHKIMQKMSTEDDDDDDNNYLNYGADDQPTVSLKEDSVIFPDNLEDNDKDIGIIGHQLTKPSSLSSLGVTHKNHRSVNSDECSAIQVLTSDCSAVKDIVPNGPLEKVFKQACNWHEVCYSCGELFGLLSSDCDIGFLEQSRLACNDSSSCETVSRLILMPLRRRRTFYKRKVPSMCYQHPCVEAFLLKSKDSR